MKEKKLFCRKKANCEDGRRMRLSYYRLTEKQGNRKNYGILIEMRRRRRAERGAVCAVTASRKEIRQLLMLLSRNLVTPCTLEEILEEQSNKI